MNSEYFKYIFKSSFTLCFVSYPEYSSNWAKLGVTHSRVSGELTDRHPFTQVECWLELTCSLGGEFWESLFRGQWGRKGYMRIEVIFSQVSKVVGNSWQGCFHKGISESQGTSEAAGVQIALNGRQASAHAGKKHSIASTKAGRRELSIFPHLEGLVCYRTWGRTPGATHPEKVLEAVVLARGYLDWLHNGCKWWESCPQSSRGNCL